MPRGEDERVDVATLAAAAGLQLSPERLAVVGEILGQWRPGCLELNRTMSEPSRRHIVPVTVFAHGADHE